MKNNFGTPIKTTGISIVLILLSFMIKGICKAQETRPDLQLDEYQIIGKDTRVFVFTGDRISTVSFIAQPLLLPEEERNVEESEGLIDDEERLWRLEPFEITEGLYAHADIFSGSRSRANIWGKASLDKGKEAGTVHVGIRQSKENTPTNSAPMIHEIDAVGYYGDTGTRFSAEIGYAGEDNDFFGERFRNMKREVGRYHGGMTVRTLLRKLCDIIGRLNVTKGSYKDYVLSSDESEFEVGGGIDAVRDIYDVTLVFHSSARYITLENDSGSFLMSGLKGQLMLFDNLGLQTGANIYLSAMPDDDTEARIYPEVNIDWAITRSLFVKASYKPEVESYSYGDLYTRNGLVLPGSLLPAPMLFEDKRINAVGEIGWRYKPGSLISASMFHTKSKDALVFNRFGNLFAVGKNATVDITGVRIRIRYDRNGIWGFDGDITVNDAKCDNNDEVPYIPSTESVFCGYIIPYQRWIVRGSLNYMGKHYVETGMQDTVDAFFTVNCGIERELLKQFSVYCDLRNITNSEGSWWTDRYQIPGVGLYAGVKMQY